MAARPWDMAVSSKATSAASCSVRRERQSWRAVVFSYAMAASWPRKYFMSMVLTASHDYIRHSLNNSNTAALMEDMMIQQQFSPPCTDATRAQILLSDHIVAIDKALSAVRDARPNMAASIADMHETQLARYRRLLQAAFDDVLALPKAAFVHIRQWNHNAHGWNVEAACRDALASAARPNKGEYQRMIAARRAGLRVVS